MIANPYTFAKAVAKRYRLTEHQCLVAYWLMMMPDEVSKAFERGELKGADILRKADELKLPGTQVALHKAGQWEYSNPFNGE